MCRSALKNDVIQFSKPQNATLNSKYAANGSHASGREIISPNDPAAPPASSARSASGLPVTAGKKPQISAATSTPGIVKSKNNVCQPECAIVSAAIGATNAGPSASAV